MDIDVEEAENSMTLTIRVESDSGIFDIADFILEFEQIAQELQHISQIHEGLGAKKEEFPMGALALLLKAQGNLTECKSSLGAAKLVASGQMSASAFGFPEFG